MRKRQTVILILFTLFAVGGIFTGACHRNGESAQSSNNVGNLRKMGIPPGAVNDSAARKAVADYAAHFWDNVGEAAAELTVDTVRLEVLFSDFVGLLTLADDAARAAAVKNLISRTAANPELTGRLDRLARKYLDDPNSPMRSEELFILFLEEWSDNPAISEEIRLRARYSLEMALKNRPGSMAADIRLIDRQGNETTLHRQLVADTTLVIFHDPDCAQCRELISALINTRGPIPYAVLTIDVGEGKGDSETREKQAFPESWRVTRAIDEPEDEGLYHFPALPSLYLISADRKVILKDFPL